MQSLSLRVFNSKNTRPCFKNLTIFGCYKRCFSNQNDFTKTPAGVLDGNTHDFTTKKYDAIIIGGGHNGLVCSNYLSKKKKVLVLEQRDILGGAASSEELVPGFKFSRFSYVLSLLRKVVVDEIFEKDWKDKLKLYPHDNASFTPTHDLRTYLMLNSDEESNLQEIGKFSEKDKKSFLEFEEKLEEIVEIVNPYIDSEPSFSAMNAISSFITTRTRVQSSLSELFHMMTAPASVILDKYFESDIIKGTFASDACTGANQSPHSPNSSLVLIHDVMGEIHGKGEWAYVQGGMGAISNYLTSLAIKRGVDVAINSGVQHIMTDSKTNKVTGVNLWNGQTIKCDTIITNCTNHIVYDKLLDNQDILPDEFRRGLKSINYDAVQVKYNLILNEIPKFRCLEHLWDDNETFHEKKRSIHINCEDMDTIHTAYKESSRGEICSRPIIEMAIPSFLDPTLVPEGSEKLVANLFVQYAPKYLSGGREWDEKNRNIFIQNTYKVVDEYAPNFSNSIEFQDVLFPEDLENLLGMTGGNLYHGAMDLNSMFFSRPMPNYSDYKGPIGGLWSCGASNHPGGGVSGAPGRNCAKNLLKYSF
ncbi:unnamed protein product [Moneuplotes crassus]|uniref:Pyridine nucleotide-disulfide oxidoreductase domain-containing protein 2 n=1 Tax=Euplotes crassus TaxID=5936 RepID=A0AAD1X6Y0_EUPCR|nr:unnamed protein product [Moneuplotes crassus]